MEVIQSGIGELIRPPDLNAFREWNRHKSKTLVDKRMSEAEAVSRFVHDGDYIGTELYGTVRCPMSLVNEVVRQGKKDLLVAGQGVLELDMLLAASLVKKLDITYIGLEVYGVSNCLRREVESGRIETCVEWSNAAFAGRFKAAAMGVPFIPLRSMLGTDTLKYSSAKVVKDPFTGDPICLIPALILDVGLIHVHRADKYGNCQVDGISGFAAEMARACKTLIVSAEEIIDEGDIRNNPDRTIIPYYLVDAVVEAPFASHPGEMCYIHRRDEDQIREWVKAAETPETTRLYLDKYIYGVRDHREYLELIGKERLESLRYPREEPMTTLEYNPSELLICTAARLMPDNTTAFIGTGIPMLAASLAQKMHAPNLVTVFEFGGTGAIIDELPTAVGGQNTFHRAVAASGICDIMETAHRGFIEYGFLGGAQIDPYGNLNSTVIGDHDHPKVRLPGSGGSNDVGSHCWQTIAVMRHDKRRFIDKVDFITTPGYLSGPGSREAAGLAPGSGPYRVVTNLALMGYHPHSKRMLLLATQPGVSVGQVVENTGFELLLSEQLDENPPPTPEELRILREEVDRDKLYI